jgi:hypothetical protein
MDRWALQDKLIRIFIKDYLPRLKRLYHPLRTLLFGSQVQKGALNHGDLDVILISPAFEGILFIERPSKVLKEAQIDLPIELFCYTPEEFEKRREEIGIVREATRYGIFLE